MEVQGKIIHDLKEQAGVSKAGNSWKKHEYVLETQESFPKQIHFDFFGDRADQYPLNVGDEIKLSFDIESREYNGRWYNSIRAWKVERNVAAAPAPAPIDAAAANIPPTVPAPTLNNAPAEGDKVDDLPF